jgi:hypothetical protein
MLQIEILGVIEQLLSEKLIYANYDYSEIIIIIYTNQIL